MSGESFSGAGRIQRAAGAVQTLTIANGGTVSSPAYVEGAASLLLITPDAFTTDTSVGFQVSVDGDTWVALEDSGGTAVTAAVELAASKGVLLPAACAAATWLRITATSAQGAQRDFKLISKS